MVNNKKNILIIGSKEYFTLENMYFRAFKTLGNKVDFFHTYNIRKKLIESFFWKFFRFIFFYFYQEKLLNFLINNKKKYDLIIVFKGIFMNKKKLIRCKNFTKNTIWINIFSDDPFNINYFSDISNKDVIKTIKYYDYFLIWSKRIVNKLKKKNSKKKIIYLPFGYDEFIHKKNRILKTPKYDLSFIGTADDFRISLLKKIKKYKIIVAGDGWNRITMPSNIFTCPKANAKQCSKIIQNSKISLNILRKQNYGSHNMKTFEIVSMNGLMLTNRSKEQNYFFPENRSCFMYGSQNEMLKKIDFLVNNYNKMLKIIRKGNQLSRAHSYRNRAKYILNEIF
tara:strand:- start:114 stop:1127 length:1014 start_codon:yes stop_codon:yes gene_type:complete